MTYFGDKVLGNFKLPKAKQIARKIAKPREKRDRRPGNSEEHLAALRKCPCIVTLKMPAGEVHHLKQGTGERGAGMRSSDKWGVPLSRTPHETLERAGSRRELAVLESMGVTDPIGMANALWHASPNIAAMTKIILAHRCRHE
jgi:hypothetical protein